MNKHDGDYEICLGEARAFLDAAKYCYNNKNISDFLEYLMYPFVVNLAFSCELFLKSIMIFRSNTNEFIAGHPLDDLFTALPVNDQNAIRALFALKCSDDLDILLKSHRDAFENWRYAFEKPVTARVSSLIKLTECMDEYSSALR